MMGLIRFPQLRRELWVQRDVDRSGGTLLNPGRIHIRLTLLRGNERLAVLYVDNYVDVVDCPVTRVLLGNVKMAP